MKLLTAREKEYDDKKERKYSERLFHSTGTKLQKISEYALCVNFCHSFVQADKYLDKFGNDGKYIYRADFRKVITKASPEETDFSVIGEISSTSVEEGCLTASFMLTEDEMEKMWDADYVVSFAVKAKDGSDGFMTAFVPVSWYSRDGSGGDKEIFEVGGHKVTMKIADGIDSKDILTRSFVDGDKVIIKAISFQGKGLLCDVGDDALCERAITNGKFTFTIREISSDIEAVLGYAPPVTLTVTSDSNGKVWIGDDKNKTNGQFEIGQQVVIHAAPNVNFRLFTWDDNNRENSRTITLGEADVTYSASFISSDLIPGLFTVNSDGKQVFFSRGNLYWNGSEYCFEDNQYTVHTKSSAETENHIAHFYWSKSSDVARSLSNYSDACTSSDVFFANNPKFKVNEHTGWSVLTSGEWKYLLDTRNQDNKFAEAKIHNMNGLLIFPDGYSLPSGYISDGGTGMSKSNDENAGFPSENIPDETWIRMDAAGVVFLPAAGYRRGDPGCPNPADVFNVGDYGYYWSASPNNDSSASYLNFSSGDVYPSLDDFCNQAYSVRLVTESK